MRDDKKIEDSILLSIIVPIYNAVNYMDECIKSILKQTHENFELILVDDGSCDGSSEKCDKWITKDNRIKVTHQQNKGASAARNSGLKLSKGKVIGFVDADDEIAQNMFEDMMYYLKHEDVDIVCCGYQNEEKDGIGSFVPRRGQISAVQFSEGIFSQGIFCVIWNKIYRREILYDEKGELIKFPVELNVGEDLVWLLRVLKSCRNAFCIDSVYYFWKCRPGSLGKNNSSVLGEKSMTEIRALEISVELSKDISEDCYYLAYKRYFFVTRAKFLKALEFEDEKVLKSICQRLRSIIHEFPCESKDDSIAIAKMKLLLFLRGIGVKSKTILLIQNKLSTKKLRNVLKGVIS